MPEIMVDPRRCLACRACELACAINRDSVSKTLAGAFKEEVRSTPRVVVQGNETIALPVQCRHCEEALCIDTCPAGALYRAEDGRVLFDDNRCIGCWMCVAVCPFGAIKPSGAGKVAIKCDACHGMERPFCVEACPTRALAYVDAEQMRQVAKRKAGDVVEILFQGMGSADPSPRPPSPWGRGETRTRSEPRSPLPAGEGPGVRSTQSYVKLGHSSGRGGRQR